MVGIGYLVGIEVATGKKKVYFLLVLMFRGLSSKRLVKVKLRKTEMAGIEGILLFFQPVGEEV